jgi:hypothetical protein
MDLDEVALNTLLAEDIDVPTAIVGSVQDCGSELLPRPLGTGWAWTCGLICGAVLFVLWILL